MPVSRRRRPFSAQKPVVWIAALLFVLAAGGAWWWLQSRDGGGEGDAVGVVDTTAVLDTAGREELPELNASDELVRRLAVGLSARPALAEWLATDSLVRRFVGATVLVAAGRSPREEVEFLGPEGPFRARGAAEVPAPDTAVVDTAVVDPASFQRYDPVAVTFVSLDTPGTAELYRRLRPLFQEAYRDLGFQEGSFHVTLARAVETLLAVPAPDLPIEVVRRGGTAWEYADPALEELSPAQKHLLRMGPENVRRVQAKLRTLADALELPMLRGAASDSS